MHGEDRGAHLRSLETNSILCIYVHMYTDIHWYLYLAAASVSGPVSSFVSVSVPVAFLHLYPYLQELQGARATHKATRPLRSTKEAPRTTLTVSVLIFVRVSK